MTAPKIAFEQREHTFLLKNVRIGIGFHWDRLEDQEFAGTLEIRDNADGTQTAINTLDLEDYLCSVISSEMNTNSPIELLKAHAVISRSWAISQIAHRASLNRTLHEGFDVCADDHCQRYEGLRRMSQRAVQAVRETAGQVLVNEQIVNDKMVNVICDCRYHKCCGGRTELWRTCWEDIDVPYIQSVDCPYCGKVAEKVKSSIANRQIVNILNDYDQETTDFHDWQVCYTAEELGDIIRRKSGIDFGDIVDLVPLKRGASGRIYELKIIGTKRTEVIGKELKIRLWLSRTCLYSSWFEVKKSSIINHKSQMANQFTLIGKGWGHGAGLCQIGAAQMAEEGYSYQQILSHYYVGTRISVAAQ